MSCLNRAWSNFFTLFLVSATAIAPVVVTLSYLAFYQQASLFDHVPILSDSVDYWHEIKSFITVGLGFGYYGYEELHASIGRFGPHGPWYPVFLGMIGRLFGFSLYSIPMFQMAFLSVCILAYTAMVKPNLPRLKFLLCFTATYPAMFFWIPFSMQETLHLALGILLAGCFVRLYQLYIARQFTFRFMAVLFSVILFATLMRFTWVLFFAPLFLLDRRLTLKNLVKALAMFGILFLLLQLLSVSLVQARFPYFDNGIGKALHGDFTVLINRFRYNFNGLFLDLQHDPMSWMFTMRYQLLMLIPFSILLTPRARKDTTASTDANPWVTRALELLPTLLLAGSIAMLFAFYLCNDIFVLKHVVPVFVFGVFFAAMLVPVRWMWTLVLINVLSLPSAFGFSNIAHTGSFDRSGGVKALISGFSQQVAPYMSFSPGASPWCNTIIISNYASEILGVPPGIALNFVRDYQEFEGPLRSRYLLAPLDADLSGLAGKADLEKLVSTSAGVLYLNRLAECGDDLQKPGKAP